MKIIDSGHYWVYCSLCNCATLCCKNCGNNMCNGGQNCDDCKEAFELSKDRTTIPKELLEREEREYNLMKLSYEDLLEEKKKIDLKDWEISLIEEEIDRKDPKWLED